MEITLDDLAGPDAADVLARLRSTGPVAWIPALDGWLVTGHDLALAVMRDAAGFTVDDPRFSTAQVVGASMLSTEGAEHRRHRTPFAPSLRAAELEPRFGAEVERLAAGLVGRIRPDGAADLRSTLAGPLSVAVMAHVLGLSDVDVPAVLGWYTAIVAAVTAITAGEAPSGAETAAVRELAAAVHASLDHGDAPVLAAARGTLSDAEIVSDAAVMMFGGIETTEGMIANLFVHLLGDAEVLGRVRADPSLVPAAVEESLRLEPAAAVVDRYATGDLTLGAVSVRRGDLVRVSLAAANRDPAVFERPDEFVLDRAHSRLQVAFARGPHSCVAMDLARLETRTLVTAALDGLPGLRLTGPPTTRGLVFRKPDVVPAAWDAVD